MIKRSFLSEKRVSVIGMGRSGIAAANLAYSLGAHVLISELRPVDQSLADIAAVSSGIALEFGGHTRRIYDADLAVKSPGAHASSPIFRAFTRKGIPVWSEIELALAAAKPGTLVAITGTNGKTTTTTLTGEIFAAAGRQVIVGGNIGVPLAAVARHFGPKTAVVVEMSSYQLEDSTAFRPDISAILNITPDHLEHHHTMKNYIAAKRRVFEGQTKRGVCVLNFDDPVLRAMERSCPARVMWFSAKGRPSAGVFYDNGVIVIRWQGRERRIACALRIPGMHNIENALAATAMAVAAGIRPAVIERTINAFAGVEHRIELCRELRGVKYYNDSKATNVDSTRVALESFSSPLWLILGGKDKGAPYTPLAGLVREKVRGILLIGEAAPLIRRDLAGTAPFIESGTIDAALGYAAAHAQAGEAVLLSPACASFDQFRNFEERGRHFKKAVAALR